MYSYSSGSGKTLTAGLTASCVSGLLVPQSVTVLAPHKPLLVPHSLGANRKAQQHSLSRVLSVPSVLTGKWGWRERLLTTGFPHRVCKIESRSEVCQAACLSKILHFIILRQKQAQGILCAFPPDHHITSFHYYI